MYESFTGADFRVALAEGRLGAEIVRTGVAKEDEKDANAILFSMPPFCASWIKIPLDLIDRVTLLVRSYPCGDHEHPLVMVHLRRTPSNNTVAAVLAELLKASGQESHQISLPLATSEPSASFLPPLHRRATVTTERQKEGNGPPDKSDRPDAPGTLAGDLGSSP